MSDPTEPRSDHDSEEATTNCLWDEYVMACADRDALKEVLSEMVSAWEPDGDGSDKRLWNRARKLLGFHVEDSPASGSGESNG